MLSDKERRKVTGQFSPEDLCCTEEEPLNGKRTCVCDRPLVESKTVKLSYDCTFLLTAFQKTENEESRSEKIC